LLFDRRIGEDSRLTILLPSPIADQAKAILAKQRQTQERRSYA
jgi:hypothetical protein